MGLCLHDQVFCSKQLDLLLLVDSSVGSIQIAMYVTRSKQTQIFNLGCRKAGFRQYPDSLHMSRTFGIDCIETTYDSLRISKRCFE